MKNKCIAFLLILSMFLCVSGCSSEYDEIEKHIVNVTVLRTEKESHWTGKFYAHDYNVYFDVGNGIEWEVDNLELFGLLQEGDEISVFRTDYLKDGKVIDSEFDFIN